MARKYQNIQENEREILKLRAQEKTRREICEQLGLNIKQIENFITRYNHRQEKIAAGIMPKKKGRPAKDSIVTEEDMMNNSDIFVGRKTLAVIILFQYYLEHE